MKTLTFYEAQTALALLTAIPFKTDDKTLPGDTIAAIALSVATITGAVDKFRKAVADIAGKVKPEGYDDRYDARDKAIKEAFPEGTDFDAAKWKEQCPDPEFEGIIAETEKQFAEARDKAGNESAAVTIGLTPKNLADIADLITGLGTVPVANTYSGHADTVPSPSVIYTLATFIN